MNKNWGILLLLSAVAGWTNAQDYPNASHQRTSAIPSARFEIVQSPLAARWTFRLDRYTGQVWQLVSTADSGQAWQEMFVAQALVLPSPTKPRFQIFTSGIAARHTFMLDADTGRTWQLKTQKVKLQNSVKEEEVNVWEPFAQ